MGDDKLWRIRVLSKTLMVFINSRKLSEPLIISSINFLFIARDVHENKIPRYFCRITLIMKSPEIQPLIVTKNVFYRKLTWYGKIMQTLPLLA